MRYHLGKNTAQSDLETDTRKATMGSGAKTTDDEQKRKLRRRSEIKVILVFNVFFFFFQWRFWPGRWYTDRNYL